VARTATSTLAPGWQRLLDQFTEDLQELDPGAVAVAPTVDSDGLLRFRARFTVERRREVRRLLDDYDRLAATTCELCGESGRVYAGPILLVRCASCCEPARPSAAMRRGETHPA
jgi:hypothetical protein